MTDEKRLTRVHVVGARAVKDGYVVVLSEPVAGPGARAARASTWEVSWDAWVASGADVGKL